VRNETPVKCEYCDAMVKPKRWHVAFHSNGISKGSHIRRKHNNKVAKETAPKPTKKEVVDAKVKLIQKKLNKSEEIAGTNISQCYT